MKKLKLPAKERKKLKKMKLKCFYIEYVIYVKDSKTNKIFANTKREYQFSKSVSELMNIDLPYELSQFFRLNHFDIDVITLTEVNY